MNTFDRSLVMNERETKYVTMRVKGGVFFMVYKKLEVLDLETAKAIVEDRVKYQEGKSYPCLFDIRGVNKNTKEARDYMADEGNDLVKASALLVNSPVLRMAANFYISVNKPKNPTRLFTNKRSALKWLEKFK